eukprot:8839556-Ditylum_brightwellii.AAC.1
MDALYTLIQDLLRGNAPTAFNNKQTTFDKQIPISWKFQMDKEDFNAKPVFATRNTSQKKLMKAVQL